MEKQSKPKKSRILQVILICISAGLIGGLIYYSWPFLSVFNNPEELKTMVTAAGAWGPVIFIFLQAAQVLIAPIPGQVMGLIGGYLFGPILGVVYTIVGATIGFSIILLITRKLGRPFVERFVSRKALDKFDNLAGEKGKFVFFFIFLLPAFPDDIISFIAGLTKIRFRDLILISLAGRLPGYAVLNFAGHELAYDNFHTVAVILIALLIILAVAFWKRKWLNQFVYHENRMRFLKEQWDFLKARSRKN